jgi:hypothetical protein
VTPGPFGDAARGATRGAIIGAISGNAGRGAAIGASDEDRAAAVGFYYGYLAARAGIQSST